MLSRRGADGARDHNPAQTPCDPRTDQPRPFESGRDCVSAAAGRAAQVDYGMSTWLMTCTIRFDAEISVVAIPAAESCSRVSLAPFNIT
jgi:hypothetical protein